MLTCCVLLEHLSDPSTKGASIRLQASSIKKPSICFVTKQHATEVEALLTRQISINFWRASFPNFVISWFSDLEACKFGNVELGRFGMIIPVQIGVRNCQSLSWAQHLNKFGSLGKIKSFLSPVMSIHRCPITNFRCIGKCGRCNLPPKDGKLHRHFH